MALTWPVHVLAGVRVADEIIVRAPEQHSEVVGATVKVGAGVQVTAQKALTLRQLLHLPGRGKKVEGDAGRGGGNKKEGVTTRLGHLAGSIQSGVRHADVMVDLHWRHDAHETDDSVARL